MYIDSSGARHHGTLGAWPVHYIIRRRDGAMAANADGALLWYLDRDTAEADAEVRYHGGTVVDGGAYDE